MICAIVMDRVTAQITKMVYIPCQIIHFGFQTVFDITAFDFTLSRKAAIPSPQIRNQQNGSIKLNVQIHALIIQIAVVDVIH